MLSLPGYTSQSYEIEFSAFFAPTLPRYQMKNPIFKATPRLSKNMVRRQIISAREGK